MIVGRMVRLLVMALIVLTVMGIRQLTEPSREVALAATIQGVGVESPAPIKVAGIFFSTGFNLQPADSYTFVGHEKTLRTSVVRPVTERLFASQIQWFQWKQGMNSWDEVKGKNNFDLTVKPQKTGEIYYQEKYSSKGWTGGLLGQSTWYSRVAKLTIASEPVSAKELAITTDNNYLYNNQQTAQQTYVHATPMPPNATGDLTWSSSDKSLATVDAKTGKVTANTRRSAGVATITGTMTNADGTSVSANVKITIGEGLTAQTVDEGQPATFKILGKFDQTPTQVIWHRVDGAGKDTVVSRQTKMSYTTPATTPTDNHNQYYAEIKVNSDGKEQTITTGQATLNVNPSTRPSVNITNAINDKTDLWNSSKSTDIAVIANDTCQITGIVTDQNPASKLSTGDLEFNLPQEAIVSGVSVDNQPATYTAVADNRMDKTYAVQNQDFRQTKTHTVVVTFKIPKMPKGRYKTGIKLRGYDGQTPLQSLGTFSGNDVVLNFTDGKIDIKANAVSFGNLTMRNLGQNIPGRATGDGELLDVADHRREKTVERITLRQVAPLSNKTGDLPATISFDPGHQHPLQPLSTTARDVVRTKDNETLSSIGTVQGQGLTLNVHAWKPGVYTTELDWGIITAP
ncbi:Ig-like domain-containing protein [Levilactobacillus angrenensis]|uniref:Ig-like domain-containing protein n=1 Tax=Levilactobacillus angrenensis TaxID=2486020 RepID=A0ABW1UA65_9LACO|nr:Ig-like domain-containing protein [Levilactobacillus angrenensis]